MAHIRAFPDFLTSLVPLDIETEAPEIIRRMVESSRRAGVGPMAAVAGAISEMTGYNAAATAVGL